MLEPIVSSKWLQKHLNNTDLIILDASQKKNKFGLSTNFEDLQIKGARHFDIKNNFSDLESKFPNTLPSAKKFEKACQKLGINKSSKIVVYDNLGVYTSPRVWWMFKTMRHHNIAVLDGGLPDWIKNGFQTEKITQSKPKIGNFKANFNTKNIKYFADIQKNIISEDALVIDARASKRFLGLVEEPRKELRSGHITKSINLPFQEVLENGKFKSKNKLTKLFTNIVVDTKPLIFTCGSGITACIILLASELVLENKKTVYDGSWTEYAQLEK